MTMSRFLRLTGVSYQRSQPFFQMLNAVFNKPDLDRIKEVGSDRACAEWLLRCGAHIRWKGADRFHKDYNTLAQVAVSKMVIEEVNADEAAIMQIGFKYFDGCKHIKRVRFHHCPYLEDSALAELSRLKDSLENLECSSCGDISDSGLMSLKVLENLKQLTLIDLPEVRNMTHCHHELSRALPHCQIMNKDLEQPPPG